MVTRADDATGESGRDLFRVYQFGRVITLVATFLVLLIVQLFSGVNSQIAYVYGLLIFDLCMTFVYFAVANKGSVGFSQLSMTGVVVDTLCMVVGIYFVGAEAERYGLIIFGFLVVMAAAVHSSRAAIWVGAASSALYASLLWALHTGLIEWRPEPLRYDLEVQWPLMPALANGAGVLALAFISGWLADSWRFAHSRAERLNRELEERVVQRTAELTRRNRSLEQAEENIRLYAQAVSHDLRSPVTVALENTKLAMSERAESRSEFLSEAIDALRRGDAMLAGLVGVMREGARIESTEPVDFFAVVRRLVSDEFRDQHCIEFVGTFPAVLVVREAIEHIARNLIRNSIVHNPAMANLRIIISASQERDSTVFKFADNGVGIRPERICRIFDPFVRGPEAAPGGLGLGLYSVKRMISRAGGSAWAESLPGEGATIAFTLPESPNVSRRST